MTRQEFETQIQRLINTYGKSHYPEERIKLLWQDTCNYSVVWLQQTITKFIAESARAPLIVEFRQEVSIERERLWALEKAEYSDNIEELITYSLKNSEIKEIVQAILRRMSREFPDNDWDFLLDDLNRRAEKAEIKSKLEKKSQCFPPTNKL